MTYNIINCLNAIWTDAAFHSETNFQKFPRVSEIIIYFYLQTIFGQLAIIS